MTTAADIIGQALTTSTGFLFGDAADQKAALRYIIDTAWTAPTGVTVPDDLTDAIDEADQATATYLATAALEWIIAA